ncbi:galactose oxidase [Gyrodon lividus]|nr:galactose oxidase [Gyrodon lividus]
MSIRWTLLSSLSNKARSSHCAAITSSGRLLLYSGELRPRLPVDGSLHVLDLEAPSCTAERVDLDKNNSSWRVLNPVVTSGSPEKSTQVPEPRVGASAVYDSKNESLYVWGGRGGVDMAPLDRCQSGIWRAQVGSGELAWERVQCDNEEEDEAPALRSFHASVLAGGKLYVHAGCPASGRLATLHAYDLNTNKWKKCADAPAEPRGGTAIAAVIILSENSGEREEVIIRFGGFAGHELPKVSEGAAPPLDIYTPSTNTWTTVCPAADPENGFPGPRSVHGLVPFTSPVSLGSKPVPVALLHHGERDASSLGHAGAGQFWDDAWLLLATPRESSVSADLHWKKLQVIGTNKPEPRGWFPSASYVSEGQTRIVLTGGLLSSNERSGEVWVGDVELQVMA